MMLNALADASRRRDAELGHADQAYQDNAAQAAGELARAGGAALSAGRWAGAAAAQVLDVDREAARLWDQLRRARGLRVRALGEVPDPAPIEALPRVALPRNPSDDAMPQVLREAPRILLARAADRIDVTIRPAGRRSLPRWALPFLPLLGAMIAALAGLLASGLVTFGS